MQLSRRDFIGAGSLALAGCCAPCAGRTYVSEPVEILRTARLRNRGERLRMAFIGSGGRAEGRAALPEGAHVPGLARAA